MSFKHYTTHEDSGTQMDRQMAVAIFKAASHVRRIAGRGHLMADRIERVNLFITSLRREIAQSSLSDWAKSEVSAELLKKQMWYDAGVFSGNVPTKFTVRQWCDDANLQSMTVSGAALEIEGDLENLGRELEGVKHINRRVDQIVEEGGQVMEELTKVFS